VFQFIVVLVNNSDVCTNLACLGSKPSRGSNSTARPRVVRVWDPAVRLDVGSCRMLEFVV
jgi:hypothetical protein